MRKIQLEKLKRDSLRLSLLISENVEVDFDEDYKINIRNWQKALREIRNYAKDK